MMEHGSIEPLRPGEERERFERFEMLVELFQSVDMAANAAAGICNDTDEAKVFRTLDAQRQEILRLMEEDFDEFGPFSPAFLRTLLVDDIPTDDAPSEDIDPNDLPFALSA